MYLTILLRLRVSLNFSIPLLYFIYHLFMICLNKTNINSAENLNQLDLHVAQSHQEA